MKQNSSPEKLLSRIVEHDERALGELYDLYAPVILGMLVRILENRPAAEDVLEEVFVRVWSDARRIQREQVSVGAALCLMAREKAVGRLRGERRLEPLARAYADRKTLAWLPRAREIAVVDDRLPLIRKVVQQIPKPQSVALELAVFGGLTQEEIAERLGEPAARVRAGLMAAMRFLRHRLEAVLGTWAANI